MDTYQVLYNIYRLCEELSEHRQLFCTLGYQMGFTVSQLANLLFSSHYNYVLAYYSLLMYKYLQATSYVNFALELHQNMVDQNFILQYYIILDKLHLFQLFWPAHVIANSYNNGFEE